MEYWMITTGDDKKEPGINGGLSKKEDQDGMLNINTIGTFR